MDHALPGADLIVVRLRERERERERERVSERVSERVNERVSERVNERREEESFALTLMALPLVSVAVSNR